MKFTIHRSKWLRGEGGAKSRLLRPEDGKMCCVGQICLQLGVPEEKIRDQGSVYSAGVGDVFIKAGFPDGNVRSDPVLQPLYAINDYEGMHPTDREKKLIDAVSEMGHELAFVH